MRKHAMAMALCGCLSLNVARSADTVQYGPAPAWVKPAVRPQDDGTMADAPVKVQLRNHQIRFTSAGLDAYTESLVRLQTAQGLQALGNLALPWKPDTDVLTVHKLQVFRGDKTIDLLANGQKFEVLRREDNLEYAALDGRLTAAIQPSGMQVGDVLNIAYSVQHKEQLSTSPELILAGFNQAPLARVEVRASWDKSVPLHWRATDEVKGLKESREGNQLELTWSADNVTPITQPTDVPLRFWREPRIVFSSYPSWNDVSRRFGPLYQRAAQLSANSPLKVEAKAIADATADPIARLEAALKLAQDRVRYVFLGMGDGGVNPANADETWERRFGDCKAKSALLIAMLGEMGITAVPVAVNTQTGDVIGDLLPMAGGFDHVIVRANVGGKSFWLDGAGSGSWRRASMTTPNYYWGLPLTQKGDGLLRMIAEPAIEPAVENSTFIDAKAGLHTDAPFTAESRIRGTPAIMLNAQLSGLSPADREQALRAYWKEQYDFVEVKTVASAYDDSTGIETLNMTGTADMEWGGYSYTTDGLSVGARADFSRKPGINVDAPFSQGHPAYVVNRQRIELPATGTFTTSGKDYDLALAGAHYSRHSKLENRVFTGEASTRSLVPEIPAAEARAAEKQLNDMRRDKLEIIASGYYSTDADVAALKTRKFTAAADLNWRGNVFLDRGAYDDAYADFDAAIKLDAKNYTYVANRGLTQVWRRNLDQAKSDFDTVLAKEPANAVALRGLGVLLVHRGQMPAAIERLTASLAVDPDNSFALGNRAFALARNGQYPEALLDTASAIRVSPQYVEMYDLRAWLLTGQDEKDSASQVISAMLAANPDSIAALKAAVRNYARLGRYPDAIAASDKVIAREPTAYNYLKRSEARDPGDIASRMADLDAALAKQPDYKDAIFDRAALQSEAGDHKGAIATYTAQLKIAGKMSEKRRLWTMRGTEYAKDAQAAASAKDFAAALGDDPDGDSYNNFCWTTAVARVNLEAALAACEKATALAPKDPAYLDSKGFVLLQLGRFDDAIAAYDAALATKPRMAPALYGRGLAKKRRCKCDAGDADIKAGRLDDPTVVHAFAQAGLTP